MASQLVCKIHPVVLFTIVDSYERRNEDARRVIGTLLGVYDKGIVEVTNCFTVPHNESEDEVAIDIEFARNMYELHRRVNANEAIVGWYSTGPDVTDHSVLIHDYYMRECKNPLHVTLDTTLRNDHLAIKAYTSSSMGVPGKTVGSLFTPLPVEITRYEQEKVALEWLQSGKHNPKRMVSMVTDLQHVAASSVQMMNKLDGVLRYVDDVLCGKLPADSNVGRELMRLVNAVPQINPTDFQEMLNSNLKDLLMVVYLSNLTRSQLALGEKLGTLMT